MGINSSNTWAPGFKPADGSAGPPQREEDFTSNGGIRKAYREADRYVYKYPERRFCTIGPKCWLKCWEVAEKTKKTKFMKVDDNVVLRLEWKKLNIEVDEEIECLQKDYVWGYLYF